MHARQILSNNAQGKQLSAGEQSDNGSQKRETGNRIAVGEVSDDDVAEYAKAKEGEGETRLAICKR